MKNYPYTKQMAFAVALVAFLLGSGHAGAQLLLDSHQQPTSQQIVNIGPCQAYERDNTGGPNGGNNPRVGGKIFLKCPANSLYRPSSSPGGALVPMYLPLPHQANVWIPFASDDVDFSPGLTAYAPLAEKALGMPSGYTVKVTDANGNPIVSSKVFICPHNLPGVFQSAKVSLGGTVQQAGGQICAP